MIVPVEGEAQGPEPNVAQRRKRVMLAKTWVRDGTDDLRFVLLTWLNVKDKHVCMRCVVQLFLIYTV